MDLVALNVQRGRDHGLPPYVKWRQLCGLRSVKSWKMFASVVSSPEVSTFFLLHRKFKNMVINCNELMINITIRLIFHIQPNYISYS